MTWIESELVEQSLKLDWKTNIYTHIVSHKTSKPKSKILQIDIRVFSNLTNHF